MSSNRWKTDWGVLLGNLLLTLIFPIGLILWLPFTIPDFIRADRGLKK